MKHKVSENVTIVECDGLGWIIIVHEFELFLDHNKKFEDVYTQTELEELNRNLNEIK